MRASDLRMARASACDETRETQNDDRRADALLPSRHHAVRSVLKPNHGDNLQRREDHHGDRTRVLVGVGEQERCKRLE